MKYCLIFLLLVCSKLMAEPKEIVFVFLSETKVSFDNLIPVIPTSMLLSSNDSNCVPMGDGCFNPQKGFIESREMTSLKPKMKKIFNKKNKFKLKTFNSIDISFVDCEKGNYFDIFCGKEKKEKKKIKGGIEVFIDVSSSMKHVDGEDKKGFCERRFFVNELTAKCEKVSVYGFDTRKINGVRDSGLCVSYGLNDRKNTVKWIKNSNADYLLVVTDLEEYQGELREYLDGKGAKLYGLGVDDFMASRLKSLIPSIVKNYCVK